MDFNSGVLVNGIDLGFINKIQKKVNARIKHHRYWLGSTKSESSIHDFKVVMDEPFGPNKGP
ncbi:hypothetical protein [Desulfosporosinus shakirovi]|uniref:hypothetical protein n=1 Tax=Desulfosporosinus shakirovi TaxID=2885154 RepID=UPI001E5DF606|nr:hypothetical protein [Desulfosporosinus sp. SRJS8]MCB8818866.1 hypothetical protein [Desulfosporosinus sp. SRJS8]